MRTALLGILIAASVMSGVACSDGDDGESGERSITTTSVEAPATTAPSAPPVGDAKVAADLVVKQSDFPPGWTHSQPADDVEDPADKCLNAGPLTAASSRAESDEFAKSDLTTSSSVALVFVDDAAARAAFAHASGNETKSCFDQAFREELVGEGVGEGEEGVELAGASLATVDFPPLAEELVAYQFTAETGGTDQPYRYSGHLVLARAGRAVLAFSFGNLGEPVPVAEQQTVAGNVVKRAPR